jgi:hypothetical protein
MDTYYVAHEGMDTFFTMNDTGYIFSSADADDEINDDLENGYCRDACERIGYEITPGLAKMFYELAKSYWEHESNLNKS